VPTAVLVVCGRRTDFFDEVMASITDPSLREAVHYLGPKSQREIVGIIDQCDVGVIPNRRNTFTEMNTPTRIFEYLARGKPVIAPRAQGILDYFGPDDLLYFELGDADDLARQLEFACARREEVRRIVERGQQIYLEHTWTRERSGFLTAVAELLTGPRGSERRGNGRVVAAGPA
jgi:glycosyltransferase involved in cell wall biosynthesis